MTEAKDYAASVIVPTYLRAEFLRLTLDSLSRQSVGQAEFEVIVCDDGSSDGTFEVVRQFEARINLRYAYQPDRGYRLSSARNMGIALARGRVCIFVDCGNLAGSEFVAAHVARHAGRTDLAVIGYIYGFDYSAINAPQVMAKLDAADIDSSIDAMKGVPELLDNRERVYAACADDLTLPSAAWALFWGGNVSASLELSRAAGGFDEAYQSWGNEDIDFGLTLKQLGATFALERNAAAIQYPHPKNVETRMQSYRKNMQYLHGKFQLPETGLLLEGMRLRDMVIGSIGSPVGT